MLTVRALRPGYFGKLREAGEVFEIPGRRALGSWMEVVGERRRLRLTAPPEAAEGPVADAAADPSTGSG
jgi:hypothetical protein